MKTKLLFISCMVILLIGTSGCGDWACKNLNLFCPKPLTNKPEFNTEKDLDDAAEIIKNSSKNIEQASEDISKEAGNINMAASDVQSKIPKEIKTKVDSHLNNIKKSSNIIIEDTNKINKASAELVAAKSLLDNASEKVGVTEKALDNMTKERDAAIAARKKAEEDRDSALHKAIRWLIIGSIVGAGALGVFGLMYGSKMCLTLSAVCIVVMSMAIFIESYFIYLAIGGGVVMAVLLGMLIYNIISEKRKSAKAIKEIVDTVEVTQDHLTEDDRIKLFGGKGHTGIMDAFQSQSTMDLIQKQKNKMSNLWMYSKINGNGK